MRKIAYSVHAKNDLRQDAFGELFMLRQQLRMVEDQHRGGVVRLFVAVDVDVDIFRPQMNVHAQHFQRRMVSRRPGRTQRRPAARAFDLCIPWKMERAKL
ncbi:MAG: hypothetical protein O7E53_02630 [Alphaproteobacteria bacterium]|nr:hypothetical protein [Alphaproteobacteria bacterium]